MADTPYVQPQAYYKDGTPIPPEKFGEAVADGQARFEEGARVYVRNAEGRLQTVDASDIHHSGIQVLHPEEVHDAWERKEYGKGLGNIAKAGAAGAARGLTLGASDYVASKVGGEETRQSLDALRRQNPITSGVSEVAGAAAPLLLSGGAAAPEEAALLAGEGVEAAGAARGLGSLAGSAVRAAGVAPRAVAGVGGIVERGVARGLESLGYEGKTLLGRTAAGALKSGASGAVEGAVYGGAQAADDQSLKGEDITAEKVIAGMGENALFGGTLGAGLGAMGPLASAAAKKLLPDKESLETFARERALKAVGRDTEKIGKDLPAAQRELKRNLVGDDLKYVLKTGEDAGKPIVQAGDNVEQILGKISQAKQEAGAALGGLKEEVNGLMEANPHLAPDMGELLDRIQTEVLDPLQKSKSTGSRSQARAVERELKILRTEHEARLGAAANDNGLEAMPPAAPSFLELDNYRQTLANNNNPKGVPLALQGVGNKNSEALKKTEKVIGDYLKEKAEAAISASGDDPAAYRELSRQYFSFNGLEKAADKEVAANARNRSVSPSDHAIGLTSFLSSLATGNVGALGAMAWGGAASIANKMLRERGNSLLSVMARRAADADLTIDTAAKAMAGHIQPMKAAGLYAAMDAKQLKAEYDRTTARIKDLTREGSALAQNHVADMTPEITAHYPNVGTAVSGKLLEIINHLGSRLPPSNVSTGMALTPRAMTDRASVPTMRKFMSAVEGALHPEVVIKSLAAGKIDRDAVDTMKATYPQMYIQLRNKVMTYVAERQDALPYSRRIYLSTVFDFVGDSSLDPGNLAALQSQVKAAQSVNQTAPSDGGPKPVRGRPGPEKLGKSFALPSATAFGNS